MLKITFKNVGQGDSIVLEWQNDNGENKIGLIDCNLIESSNPVLDYLKQSNYSEIEFILLSHPHEDHFSGLRQVIDYCENKNMFIKHFWHTSFQSPEFLKAAVKSLTATKELNLLFRKIHELSRRKKVIGNQGYVLDSTKNYQLSADIFLQFLAPSQTELDKYQRNIRVENYEEESVGNSANANWLSTVLKISGGDWYVLLTSDCERMVLKNLWIDKKGQFTNQKLYLAQSPHHGAFKNHNQKFWQRQNSIENNPFIVFSVGNNQYRHPSEKVISDFDKKKYKIHSTNKIGGFVGFNEESAKISRLLDVFSEIIPSKVMASALNGDQCFVVENGCIKYLSV